MSAISNHLELTSALAAALAPLPAEPEERAIFDTSEKNTSLRFFKVSCLKWPFLQVQEAQTQPSFLLQCWK